MCLWPLPCLSIHQSLSVIHYRFLCLMWQYLDQRGLWFNKNLSWAGYWKTHMAAWQCVEIESTARVWLCHHCMCACPNFSPMMSLMYSNFIYTVSSNALKKTNYCLGVLTLKVCVTVFVWCGTVALPNYVISFLFLVCQTWRSVSCQNVGGRRSWEEGRALCHVAAAPQTSPNSCLKLYQVQRIQMQTGFIYPTIL